MHVTDSNEAYQLALRALLKAPIIAPRGLPCHEIRTALIEILHPSEEPITTASPERNAVIRKYTFEEFALYDSKTDRVEHFAQASKFWTKIANEDGTVNSAYGKIIWRDRSLPYNATPWMWAKRALEEDAYTRQATLLFMRPDHLRPCKDVICTSHGQFCIRDNELHFTVVMRSNDVVKGFVYDAPWFQRLQLRMLREIGEHYPNLRPGRYTHIVHSFHLYTSDVPLAKEMLFSVS